MGSLGRVDEFNQYQCASEADEGGVAGCGLVAAHGDAFEAFEFADRLLDACASAVQPLREELASCLGIFATRDDRGDAARASCHSVGAAVVSLVGHRDTRTDVGSDIERGLELGGIAGFAAGQVEVERVAVEIGLEVNFGREAATRAANGLALLPPFAPAAETWARAVVLSKNCTRCAVWLYSARS